MLQVADYCTWAIGRWKVGGDSRSYDLIRGTTGTEPRTGSVSGSDLLSVPGDPGWKTRATRVREANKGPAGRWWVMQDPEGNEFCVA